VILMMSIFSIYCRLIYNEFFSAPFNILVHLHIHVTVLPTCNEVRLICFILFTFDHIFYFNTNLFIRSFTLMKMISNATKFLMDKVIETYVCSNLSDRELIVSKQT
jgi:hypothetical protein